MVLKENNSGTVNLYACSRRLLLAVLYDGYFLCCIIEFCFRPSKKENYNLPTVNTFLSFQKSKKAFQAEVNYC